MVSPEETTTGAVSAQRVAEVAVELTRRASLAGCTVTSLCAKLHVSPWQLSRYVATQDAVITLVLTAVAGQTLEGMPALSRTTAPAWPGMYLGNFRAVLLQHPGTARAMRSRFASQEPPGPLLVNQFAGALTLNGIGTGRARIEAVDALTAAAGLIDDEDIVPAEIRNLAVHGQLGRHITDLQAAVNIAGYRLYSEVLRKTEALIDMASTVEDASGPALSP